MEGGQILLVIAALLAFAGLAYWGWLQAKKRREALAALAARLGWRFDPERDHSHDEEFAHFELFRRGHSRSAFNTLSGNLELAADRSWPVRCGDFRYRVTSGSGKNRRTTTHTFSYLILRTPWRRAPKVLIRPEGLFDKLAGAFGFDDIDFESAEFSRRFFVKGDDKRFAYDLCHPRMMEFLMAQKPKALDWEEGELLICDGSSSWTPEQFEQQIDFAGRFFALWPEHLVKELG